MDSTLNNEIKAVIQFLGRETDKGEVKDVHLQKILAYLIKTRKQDYKKTEGILSLTVSMDKRRIRENYLEGLEYLGIIDVYMENNVKYWEYKGIPETNPLLKNPEAEPYLKAKYGENYKEVLKK